MTLGLLNTLIHCKNGQVTELLFKDRNMLSALVSVFIPSGVQLLLMSQIQRDILTSLDIRGQILYLFSLFAKESKACSLYFIQEDRLKQLMESVLDHNKQIRELELFILLMSNITATLVGRAQLYFLVKLSFQFLERLPIELRKISSSVNQELITMIQTICLEDPDAATLLLNDLVTLTQFKHIYETQCLDPNFRTPSLILQLIGKSCETASASPDYVYFLKFPELILQNLKRLIQRYNSPDYCELPSYLQNHLKLLSQLYYMDDDNAAYDFTHNKDLNQIILKIFTEDQFSLELKIQAIQLFKVILKHQDLSLPNQSPSMRIIQSILAYLEQRKTQLSQALYTPNRVICMVRQCLSIILKVMKKSDQDLPSVFEIAEAFLNEELPVAIRHLAGKIISSREKEISAPSDGIKIII